MPFASPESCALDLCFGMSGETNGGFFFNFHLNGTTDRRTCRLVLFKWEEAIAALFGSPYSKPRGNQTGGVLPSHVKKLIGRPASRPAAWFKWEEQEARSTP